MPLKAGERIGGYEVVAQLGAGGMGEVYRASDQRLQRDVAIKILAPHIAADADGVRRFEREARMLAALNHPHIAAIYGVEETAGHQSALVLEFVDGETLADRLARGKLPVAEAIDYARQIADALDTAHEAGIVHRDLKPGNIKITSAGAVKVLDFGLAKALAAATEASPDVDPAHSPTITVHGTQHGVILGTAAYMSPEQARGKRVDKRTDIWAFGCVLYEMLSGRRAFGGETTSDVIAAIIERAPDWSALPATTPGHLRRVIEHCVEKDPRQRLRDIADVRSELDKRAAHESPQSARRLPPMSRPAAVMSATLILGMGAVLGSLLTRRVGEGWRAGSVSVPPEVRLEITTPPTTDPVSLALSPDGQKLVYVAISGGQPALWLRALNHETARVLPGTDRASFPFWSPDSRAVGFFANGQLKRIDIDTGAIQALAPASSGRGGAWTTDGILFNGEPGQTPIVRVSASGGKSETIIKYARFPQVLPDGKHFLYFVPQGFTNDNRSIWVARLDGSDQRRLVEADSPAVYASSGHILFVRQGTLMAQPFDLATLSVRDTASSIAAGVSIAEPQQLAALSASAAGPIVYRTGSPGGLKQVAWFDRSGRQMETVGGPVSNLLSPAMSPDGTRVAFHRSVNSNSDIWLLDLERAILSRLTTEPIGDFHPVWSPDGSQLIFARASDLYQQPVAVGAPAHAIMQSGRSEYGTSWSRDGKFLLYIVAEPTPTSDIWALPMHGDRTPIPVAVSREFDERDAEFSPDGKWVAFQSDASGHYEIYVQSFANPDTRVQISSAGGVMPRWRSDGKELFYVTLDETLMAVPIRAGAERLDAGQPAPLFRTRMGGALPGNSRAQYVPSADGSRFLINTLAEEASAPITVILNWRGPR